MVTPAEVSPPRHPQRQLAGSEPAGERAAFVDGFAHGLAVVEVAVSFHGERGEIGECLAFSRAGLPDLDGGGQFVGAAASGLAGLNDQVHGNDELEARPRAAVRAATSADTELWERTTSRQRVFPLENADLLVGGGAADEDVLGRSEEVDRVLAKLSPAEREVADCYAVTGLTWQQAALQAGQSTLMGERVRRKLKRLAKEFQRRRSSETNPR
ncbi:hypothetical protein ACWD7C_31270 [Streptomyces sp. NPDC005134]|uniref:hypothetical protein n=1 Tax=Streptomyces sp. NPDC005098 TaxID=3154560 RepID=UPI0033B3B594